jgi:hypothetical protein
VTSFFTCASCSAVIGTITRFDCDGVFSGTSACVVELDFEYHQTPPPISAAKTTPPTA